MRNSSIRFLTILMLVLLALPFLGLLLAGYQSHGDWQFMYANSMADLYMRLPQVWATSDGLGATIFDLSGWPRRVAMGLVGGAGFDSTVATKLFYIIPALFFAIYGSFALARHITASRVAGIAAAALYVFNTFYLIRSRGQLTLLVATSLAPIALYLFIKMMQKPSGVAMAKVALFAFLITVYDFRIFYIVLVAQAIYAAFVGIPLVWNLRKQRLLLGKLGAVCIGYLGLYALLSTYWVLPLMTMGSLTSNEVFNRGLFGNEFLNIVSATTLYHLFWTGGRPTAFIVNPVPIYAWITPFVAFLALVLDRHKKRLIYFGVLALLGIVLTKQVAEPFSSLYLWLFENVPGFNAFREATKFHVLISLGYSVLFGAFVLFAWRLRPKRRVLRVAVPTVLLLLAFTPLLLYIRPLVTGDIGGLYESKRPHPDYAILKNYLTGKEATNTLYVPAPSRWAFHSNTHNRVGYVAMLGMATAQSGDGAQALRHNYTDYIKTDDFSERLVQANVSHIVVPVRDVANDDDFFVYYGDDRKAYIEQLDAVPTLRKLTIGTKDIVVYENMQYRPYVSAATNVFAIPNSLMPEKYKQFIRTTMGVEDPEFTTDTGGQASAVTDVAETIDRSMLAEGGVNIPKQLDKTRDNTLQLNKNASLLQYSSNKGSIVFNAASANTVEMQHNRIILGPPQPVKLASVPAAANKKYFAYGGKGAAQEIDARTTTVRTLGNFSNSVGIYSFVPQAALVSDNFDKNERTYTLTDCNPYDNSPIIGMAQPESSRGQSFGRVLELSAERHTACSGRDNLKVTPGTTLYFGFDYTFKNTTRAGYEILFDDPKRTKIQQDVSKDAGKWRRYDTFIMVPADATTATFRLKGYPDATRQQTAHTRYDNVVMALANRDTILLTGTSDTPAFDLRDYSSLQLHYADPSYKPKNVIANPSFEQGLWQKAVGDCNNFDAMPRLRMAPSRNSSHGGTALQLEAARHVACTSQSGIGVQEGKSYLLQFDYQSPNAQQAGFHISFDDPGGSSISDHIAIKKSNWHTYNKVISIPYGATEASITVYSYSEDLSEKNIITRYDNFYLTEVPSTMDRVYVLSKMRSQLGPPATISFHSESPTKKNVSIKGARQSFYLVMSESYHPRWQAVMRNAKVQGTAAWSPFYKPDMVRAKDHLQLNGWQNGWYINVHELCVERKLCKKTAADTYTIDLTVEFTPQRWFYLGGGISMLTFLGIAGYLAYKTVRRRHLTESAAPPPPGPLKSRYVLKRAFRRGKR